MTQRNRILGLAGIVAILLALAACGIVDGRKWSQSHLAYAGFSPATASAIPPYTFNGARIVTR